MIPLADLSRRARAPLVNRLLLLVNMVVWVYVLSLGGDPAATLAFYERYSFDWSELVEAVARGGPAVDTFAPLFTHLFLHGGWLHLIGNMLYLWIFGDNVEDSLGHLPYLIFYLACGVCAAAVQGVVAPAPMVGASGAVAGVLGAYLVLFPGARVRTLIFLGLFITVIALPAIVVIGFWIVIQVLSGLAELRVTDARATEQVAYFAHIGGFVAGIVLVLVFRPRGAARLR